MRAALSPRARAQPGLTLDAVRAWGAWDDGLLACIEGAFGEARESGHFEVLGAHALIPLWRAPAVQTYTQLAHVNADVVVGAVAGMLARAPFDASLAAEPAYSPHASDGLARVLQACMIYRRGAGHGTARAIDALVFLVRLKDELAAALAAAGVKEAELVCFAAHQCLRHADLRDADCLPGDKLELVMHNDDYTTQEFVVGVLKETLDLSQHEAARHMLEVHQRGSASLLLARRAEAIALANTMLSIAREQGMPLLVSLRAARPGAG